MAVKPHSPRRPWTARLLWNDLKRSWFMHVTLRRMANPVVYTPTANPTRTLGQWIALGPTEPSAMNWTPFTPEQLRKIDEQCGRPHTLRPTSTTSS